VDEHIFVLKPLTDSAFISKTPLCSIVDDLCLSSHQLSHKGSIYAIFFSFPSYYFGGGKIKQGQYMGDSAKALFQTDEKHCFWLSFFVNKGFALFQSIFKKNGFINIIIG